ncbi:uncharacterized protein METZ01_LOCUS275387, partial [marine metagenome]
MTGEGLGKSAFSRDNSLLASPLPWEGIGKGSSSRLHHGAQFKVITPPGHESLSEISRAHFLKA